MMDKTVFRFQPQFNHSSAALKLLSSYPGYIFALTLSFVSLYAFSFSPLSAVLFSNIVLCAYIVSLFNSYKYRWIVFLYPILIYFISQSFTGNWFDAGDGPAYTLGAEGLYDDGLHGTILGITSSYDTTSVYLVAKVMSIGASFGYLLNFSIFDLQVRFSNQDVFVASQGYIYLCLIAFVAALIKKWRILNERGAFVFVAFLLISPTVLEFYSAPSRHLVTLAGLSLLCVTHLALSLNVTLDRVVCFCFALSLIIISKAPLLLAYMLFVLLASGQALIRRNWAIFVVLLLAITIALPDIFSYFGGLHEAYSDYKIMGMNTFDSAWMSIPLVGWVIKYIYALLAPFPWTKFEYFTITNYSGSYLLFVIHMLSSITGVYLFAAVIIRWRRILYYFKIDHQFRVFVLFGLVMSTSIILGATGFHGYLSIYFPFLTPLLLRKDLRINIAIPVSFVVIANILHTLLLN